MEANANIGGWIAFVLALVAMTGVLVWGLRLITRVLKQPADPEKPDRTLMQEVLSEKAGRTAGDGGGKAADDKKTGSFSRVAGAVGTIAIAATFVGLGYWIVYSLFFKQPLEDLAETGVYFLAGAALFAPYAFNQLSSIFKTPV